MLSCPTESAKSASSIVIVDHDEEYDSSLRGSPRLHIGIAADPVGFRDSVRLDDTVVHNTLLLNVLTGRLCVRLFYFDYAACRYLASDLYCATRISSSVMSHDAPDRVLERSSLGPNKTL